MMRMTLKEAVIILIIGTAYSSNVNEPLDKPLPPAPPSSNTSYPFLPILQSEALPCTTVDSGSKSRNGLINTRKRWKNFNIHPDTAFNKKELQVINDALYNLKQVLPCITFGIWAPNSKPKGDYVQINRGIGKGCYSIVGRKGGSQEMNLDSPGCIYVGTVMHEMIHALGFYHEQARPDRDDYVEIIYENIEPGFEDQFDKVSSKYVTSFGVSYNVQSIMHYGGYDFSKNGKPTIIAKNGAKVGMTGQLEKSDIRKLKLMYKC